MPCASSLVAESLAFSDTDGLSPMEPAESIPLYLPSSLPEHLRQLPDLANVLERECRLRIAQADDALSEIRHQHRVISGLWQFKKLNIDDTGNRLARVFGLFITDSMCALSVVQGVTVLHVVLFSSLIQMEVGRHV
jgi:hypothetical protein